MAENDLCIHRSLHFSRTRTPRPNTPRHCRKCSNRTQIHRFWCWINPAPQCCSLCPFPRQLFITCTSCSHNPFLPALSKAKRLFRVGRFEFCGDTSVRRNGSDTGMNVVEFVTAPNNPDRKMNKAVLGSYAKQIYDFAYYWPHFTPISAPADEDIMIFTISKITGHAGSTFGWTLIKDEALYNKNDMAYHCKHHGGFSGQPVKSFEASESSARKQRKGKI